MTDDQIDTFYDENEELFDRTRASIKEGMRTRISEKIGNEEELTLVDVTTLKYSSQKLISELLDDRNIRGIYYFVLDDRSELPHCGYSVRRNLLKLGDNVNVIEFFMTSPEPPIDGISEDGAPMFKHVSADEKIRLNIYDQVTEGELAYAEKLRTTFKEHLPVFGRETIAAWINTLVYRSDRKTREMLTDMKWPVDANHETYVSMIYHPRDTLYHLKKDILDLGWFVFTKIR